MTKCNRCKKRRRIVYASSEGSLWCIFCYEAVFHSGEPEVLP